MCDYEPMDFQLIVEPVARKEHQCEECHGVIVKGEKYHKMTYKYDGYIGTRKVCLPCLSLFVYAQNNDVPVEATYSHTGCLYFGELHEVVRQSPELCPEEMLSPMMKELRDKSLTSLAG